MQTSNQTIQNPFLFSQIVPSSSCDRCFDTGLWRKPSGEVDICPNVQMMNHTDEPNKPSQTLRRATNRLFELGIAVNAFTFDLARILTHFSSDKPCRRDDLDSFFFADTNFTESERNRKIAKMVEELRTVWLLPIGSRKEKPSGYWIITELSDFKLWVERAKSAPITQLSTIHKNAKHNFPFYAEQMEMEFSKNLLQEAAE